MQHQIENELLNVTVKEQGAEICSIRHQDSGIEYIWGANANVWGRHAPVLFPIVGKLQDNKYSLKGREYSLPQHGFGRDKDWELAEKGENSLSFRLNEDSETLKNYPFAFELKATYSLNGNTLTVTYQVQNRSEEDMPFSIGAHPGFNCPLKNGEQFDDYYLEFEKPETLSRNLLNNGLRTGEKSLFMENKKELPLTEELFSQDALVFEGVQSDWVALKSRKSAHGIHFGIRGFPYLGIWTKAGNNEFICIEPWYGVADRMEGQEDLFQKEAIQVLPPAATFSCSYSMKFF